MRRIFLSLGLMAGVLLSLTQVSHAQLAGPPVNCAALSNSPFMCLKNFSRYPVVGVQANVNPGYSQQWLPIPGGQIPPGGTTVMNFGNWNGKCRMYVSVRTADGQTHQWPNVDVCRATSFEISGW